MEMGDFQMYKTTFELALDGYEAELQGMPAGALERGGRMISGRKPVVLKKHEEKLRLIEHVKAEVPYLFRERPGEKYCALVNRHYDALAALSEAEQALLDDEDFAVSGLDDEERAIIENEPQRLESCLRNAIRKFARQVDGELLKILIDAVERRIEWRQLEGGEENALLIDYDRKALEFLKEFLPAAQAAEPAAVDGATDRQEPEYLLKWAESTNGKKHGVWKELFMLQAFRDEVKAMANKQMKMAPVLKAYWNKHETLRGKGHFDSFRKGFGGYPKCRDLFPE